MNYYIVDAFTDEVFKGNQAGVCLLEHWLDDAVMQNIAMENNLAETAFLVECENGYELRWFTPELEIDLCGHATLASAFVLMNIINREQCKIDFYTKSGKLTVVKKENLFEMDFPSRKPVPTDVLPIMEEAINLKVLEAHKARDLLLIVESEEQVQAMQPNMEMLKKIPDCFAVIVSARGKTVDFVSRFFAPNAGIPEDPVTGSSHSTLIPFWAERLCKDEMTALQLSKRGGKLFCVNSGERVKISGYAALYLKGEILY